MDRETLILNANKIAQSSDSGHTLLAESSEFLRIYAGEKSAFYKQLQILTLRFDEDYVKVRVQDTLQAFIRFVEKDLLDGISIERRAQIDVVSDYLEQAQKLLENKNFHPAAACVLIGASLEEFLRNWIEESSISLGNSKPGLDTYSKLLRESDSIAKQDMKDINSWAGLRNHAAHGEWDEVSDRKRIELMLEGVNLFMRKYGT